MQRLAPARFDSEPGEAARSYQPSLESALCHRLRSSGQRAATPGITMSRKPMGACSATESTRLMPNSTKAIAKTTPAAAYNASAPTNNSANCTSDLLSVNWDRSPSDLCAGIRGKMQQEGRHLRRLHPLRPVGIGIAGAISWRIHRAWKDGICGDATVFVLQRNRPDQRDQCCFGCAVCTHHGRGFYTLPAGHRQDSSGPLLSHLGQHRPGGVKCSSIIKVEHSLKRGVIGFGDALSARESSHYVHKRVDTAEAGDHFRSEFPGCFSAR